MRLGGREASSLGKRWFIQLICSFFFLFFNKVFSNKILSCVVFPPYLLSEGDGKNECLKVSELESWSGSLSQRHDQKGKGMCAQRHSEIQKEARPFSLSKPALLKSGCIIFFYLFCNVTFSFGFGFGGTWADPQPYHVISVHFTSSTYLAGRSLK
jgi:hypothetical protein